MTTTSQRYSRSLADTVLVGLVLPVTTAAPAAAEEAPYTGFSTESTATPVRVEIYEPTIPIPSTPQAEVEFGYTRVEADTGSSRGRASYLWPGDAVGEGFKTIVENLGLPPELSGPIAAQGYPFQVNSTSPTGEESQADEPFPGMVMRTVASPEETVAATGYSTDCQAEEPESDGGGGGDAPAPPTLPLLESLSLPGLGGADGSSEDQQDTEGTRDAKGKNGKSAKQAEEPEKSCKIPAELAALVDFGGYVSTSSSTNDGSTVAEGYARARRQREGTRHRGLLGWGETHQVAPRVHRALRGRRCGGARLVACVDVTCVRFPSGLSPSVQELHLINRSLAVTGSRTFTAGSELHRPQSTRAEKLVDLRMPQPVRVDPGASV